MQDRIANLSESLSPLSETDDVVHNIFSQYTIHEVLQHHSHGTNHTKYVLSTLSVSK